MSFFCQKWAVFINFCQNVCCYSVYIQPLIIYDLYTCILIWRHTYKVTINGSSIIVLIYFDSGFIGFMHLLPITLKHPYDKSLLCIQGRPFRATQFWNDAVDNLKTNIDLKRKRVKMKWHDHCFSGCDAVEVVLQHLQQEQLLLHNKTVTRDKAVKVFHLKIV